MAWRGSALAQMPLSYSRPIGDGDQATLATTEVATSTATSTRRAVRPRAAQAIPSTVARNTAARTIEV
jgi:hypothetical protein